MEQFRKRRRRQSVALLMGTCSVGLVLSGRPAMAQNKKPTAEEVVATIREHVGIPWQKETVDTFKAGNPDTPVTGIAVTMMATMDVLERAAANGQNLVITHEPTFYNHLDQPDGMDESDAVWKEKRAFLEKHGMVVWRFHITGTGENRTEFWPEWCAPWAGRIISRKRIRICSQCRRER